MKEEMNSFDIAVVSFELDSTVRGTRIDNIYQINPKTLLLKLHGSGQSPTHLLIEAGKRIHLTSYLFDKPLKPSAFSMALRKHLKDGRIEKVQQYEFERIVEITIKSKGEEYRLISEIFGHGNIILVGSENKILQALSYRRMKDRNILRGEAFKYPPSSGKNPKKISLEDLYELGNLDQIDVVRALTRFLSIGGSYAEEILIRAGVEKNVPCHLLRREDIDLIFKVLQEILSEITVEKIKPCIFIDEEGSWVDVAPMPLKRYAHLNSAGYRTFNEALDEYYTKTFVGEKATDIRRQIELKVTRLKRVLQDQEETLRDLKEMIKVNSEIGDVIYRHLNDLQLLIQRVMDEKRNGTRWEDITEELQREKEESLVPAIYFNSIKPETPSLQVSVENRTFDLDLKKSAQNNAAEYYMRAKKAKRKIAGGERAIEQTKEKIGELGSQIIEKMEEVSKPPLKKLRREWYEKFRWFHSSDGFLVIGGKDATTNEILVKKHMEPHDIVFHADILGAPFVLIKTEGKTPLEQTMKEAAQLAASYSRSWKEMLTAINVYWVSPQQVSKHPPSGQYLPKGSFMIYGTKKYLRNVPIEVAIGIKRDKTGLNVIGGPSEAIARQTASYVILTPGGETSGKLAKRIRSRLAELPLKEDERREVLKIPLEEIQRFIPSGRGAMRSS